jgi:hypothetical protein
MTADIEHLFVHPVVIDNQLAGLKRSADRVFNRLSGSFLVSIIADQRRKIVPSFAEDVVAAVRIVHASRAAPYPLGNPNTRSPMMLRWISLVPPAIVY